MNESVGEDFPQQRQSRTVPERNRLRGGAPFLPLDAPSAPRPSGVWGLMGRVLSRMLSPLPAPSPLMIIGGPGLHLRWRWGWVRGWLVRPPWRLRSSFGGPRIHVGRRFSMQGSVRARGPGTIEFGDDVVVLDSISPYTHSAQATIRVGDRCGLNGVRMGCAVRIDVGSDVFLGDARIMDTDFHPVSRRRSTDRTLKAASAPIRIGDNVWIASGAAVLKGVRIGRNAVIAFGAVVTRDVADDKIAAGNPAREVAAVPD